MHFQKILFHYFVFISIALQSQIFTISGTVKNNKEPLAFATVLVKGTSMGCNSNSEGLFNLSLAKGEYEIEFQYLGYSKIIKKINLNQNLVLDVSLSPEGISLKEIEIFAGEDPSYPIIRQAIKKRAYYLNQIAFFSCKAYIKGFQKVVELPKNFDKVLQLFGGKASDTNQLKGILYLSESESDFYFKKPNQIQEIMFSSKVSGNTQAFSYNKLSDLYLNFNKNLIDMPGLSDRPLVSPIHENAFNYYKYFLVGNTINEGKKINIIKILPKHNTDPCFSGTIYIQDSTYRITGLNLKLVKANKINFVDTLYIKQIHAPIYSDSIWMPININLSFDFKVLGVKGYGYYNAHLKAYDLINLRSPSNNKNEILNIAKAANLKDTSYWRQNRPTPLTYEETKDYRTKDSIKIIGSTKAYQDSLDKLNNKFKLSNLLTGYTYNHSYRKIKLTLPGLADNGIQYNTIEGLNISCETTFEKKFENFNKTELVGKVRYGFFNRLLGGELLWQQYLKPTKFTHFGIKIKSIVEQYNHQIPISPIVNSFYTLFLNENYLKLYKETAIEANYFSELINGIYFRNNIKYAQRDKLLNQTNLLLVDNAQKLFTSNDPGTTLLHDTSNLSSRAFTAEFIFSFRFKQKYFSIPNQKIIIGSKYPKLNISYKIAIPILNTSANYDLMVCSLFDDIKLGLLGKFAYRVSAGAFLNVKKIYFMDFKYFLGNQTIINSKDYLNSFRMLPYYNFSADRWYSEAHAEHHFRGFFITKIPLLKKLSVQELIGFHALTNNRLKYYYELNFGLEKIFKILRFDYVVSYSSNSKMKQGFTFGIAISL